MANGEDKEDAIQRSDMLEVIRWSLECADDNLQLDSLYMM